MLVCTPSMLEHPSLMHKPLGLTWSGVALVRTELLNVFSLQTFLYFLDTFLYFPDMVGGVHRSPRPKDHTQLTERCIALCDARLDIGDPCHIKARHERTFCIFVDE